MDRTVDSTEQLCDAVEKMPSELIEQIAIVKIFGDIQYLCIGATCANIRLFYYITKNHSPPLQTTTAFEQFKFIMTDPRSGWYDLRDDDKIAFIKNQSDIMKEVFVFK